MSNSEPLKHKTKFVMPEPPWSPGKVLRRIKENCHGYFPLDEHDARVLAKYGAIDGDYVEIGTGFGTSAILVAMLKKEGKVHCIDPLNGYYGLKGEKMKGIKAHLVPEILIKNAYIMGVEDKLIIHPYSHPPWPEAIENHEFTSGFIDGTHTGPAAKADFESMRQRVTRFIIFHDIDKSNVGNVFDRCAELEEWEIEYKKFRIGVLRKHG